MQVLNSDQLVIRVRLLDLVENLQNFVVLVLHVDQSELLSLVLADEVDQLTALLDLVETLDELVGECVDPLGEFALDFDQSLADVFLPVLDNVDGWLVLDDGLARVLLDGLELFELLLVLLVNVV